MRLLDRLQFAARQCIPHSPGAGERIAVLVLCLLGAVHVFVFAAAFPFFSVVDEQAHFDLAVRYSQGEIPRSLTPPSEEALLFIVFYGTPEYLWPPSSQPGGVIPPPPWRQSMEQVRPLLLAKEAAYRDKFQNYEAASPPLYYALAGGCWRLGRLLQLDGGQLLYWLRFLNAPLMALLVWLGWLAGRTVFPENLFIRLSVPALIAFLPQTSFYAINNDMLTPITFGAAFVLVIRFWEAPAPSVKLAAGCGLALAAAYLTKTSNVPLLAAAAVFLLWKFARLAAGGTIRKSAPAIAALAATAALPAGAWMLWCKANFGDFAGAGLKIHFLGWTDKPWPEWLHHPLFTPRGLWFFVERNLATFWQGEMLWQRQPLSFPVVDAAYVILSLVVLTFALAALLRRRSPFSGPQRAALAFGFLCLAASFAFYAWLSVKYDFQDCFYPSRAHPFFVSGRLMLGMLVPFFILFAAGLDRLMNRFDAAMKFVAFLGLLAFMILTEIAIDQPVFSNQYNWFHL